MSVFLATSLILLLLSACSLGGEGEPEKPTSVKWNSLDAQAMRPYKALEGYLKRRKKSVNPGDLRYWTNNKKLFWFCPNSSEIHRVCYKMVDEKKSWIISEHSLKKGEVPPL